MVQVETSRRQLLKSAAVGGLATSLGFSPSGGNAQTIPGKDFRASGKNVKQSVMAWCLSDVPTDKLIAACSKMGLAAMEGISPEHYPAMRAHGLAVSLVGSHSFKQGPVSPDNREYCAKKLHESIDLAVQWNCPRVITFTGMREKGINDAQSMRNCIDCWKDVMPYAEEKNIDLALEHLNSRDDSHPMKGHPGYFGDDLDLCVDLIRQVDSPRMRLLFDIYHVQVMHGDVIRRFRQYHEFITHVHTAGNPGRGELDQAQELYYPAIIQAILETGYSGYVTQEFIPTWDDPLASLRHGVAVCDV